MLPPRAYKFLFLNAVRFSGVVALLLVFSSNIVVMVEDIKAVRSGETTAFNATDLGGHTETYECDYYVDSTVPNQSAGVFWAVINRLFILGTTILMLFSEFGWPEKFFVTFMPVLGPDFGVGILGGLEWITAASILSHHVGDFPLVAAWLLFAFGCINILLGLFFRAAIKTDRSITTFRDTKARELLPAPVQSVTPHFKILETSVGSIFEEKGSLSKNNTGTSAGSHSSSGIASGYGFGRQAEKAAWLRGFMVARPVDSLPKYAPRSTHSGASDDNDQEGNQVPNHVNRI